jgi:hypothetical protein
MYAPSSRPAESTLHPLILIKTRAFRAAALIIIFSEIAQLELVLNIVIVHQRPLVWRTVSRGMSSAQEWAL